MDPNATVAELRRLAILAIRRADGKDWQDDDSDTYDQCEAATQMAELFQALDTWMMGGGFKPAAWGG